MGGIAERVYQVQRGQLLENNICQRQPDVRLAPFLPPRTSAWTLAVLGAGTGQATACTLTAFL